MHAPPRDVAVASFLLPLSPAPPQNSAEQRRFGSPGARRGPRPTGLCAPAGRRGAARRGVIGDADSRRTPPVTDNHRMSADRPEDEPAADFRALALPEPLMRALADVGYESPSPIQAATIPPLLAGRDMVGQAQTGT